MADSVGMTACSAGSETLRAEALGEGANLGVLDHSAAQVFFGGLQHGAAYVFALDVERAERLQQAEQRLRDGVEFRDAGGRGRVDEGWAPAVCADQGHQFVFGSSFYLGPEGAAVGAGPGAADVMERRGGVLRLQRVRGGDGVVVRNFYELFFAYLRHRNAQAEQAGADVAEGVGDRRVVGVVRVDELAELGVRQAERLAHDRAQFVDDRRDIFLHRRGGEAGAQDGAARGSARAEKQDFHGSHSRRTRRRKESVGEEKPKAILAAPIAASVRFFSDATKGELAGGDGESLFRVVDAGAAAHEALAAARERDGSGTGGVYGFSDRQDSGEAGRHDSAGWLRAGSFGGCVHAGDVFGFGNFRRGRMRTGAVGGRLERGDFPRAHSLRAGLQGEAERYKG
jgi:hypothetical protein